MGDQSEEKHLHPAPLHEVCVDDFFIGKFEVTVEEFMIFIQDSQYKTDAERDGGCLLWTGSRWKKGSTVKWSRPGYSQTQKHPVVCISWNDAREYVAWKKRKTGLDYRLPTEAEWEYAARSGGKEETVSGTGDHRETDRYAWYWDNSGKMPHRVGQKEPNGLGLYDMSGNVWEWVQDWYDDDYYNEGEKSNPMGPSSGIGKVMRGGSWYVIIKNVRTFHRNWSYPHKRYSSIGFRLAL